MLEYDKIGISECIKINKTSDSHECIVCHYRYISKINLLLSYLSVTAVKIYRKIISTSKLLQLLLLEKMITEFTFWYMTKSETVNRMKNADLSEKGGQL